ncbi:unnamed protein product [Victoria cruziana]
MKEPGDGGSARRGMAHWVAEGERMLRQDADEIGFGDGQCARGGTSGEGAPPVVLREIKGPLERMCREASAGWHVLPTGRVTGHDESSREEKPMKRCGGHWRGFHFTEMRRHYDSHRRRSLVSGGLPMKRLNTDDPPEAMCRRSSGKPGRA